MGKLHFNENKREVTSSAAQNEPVTTKKKSNDVASFNDGNQCESGSAALCNDRGSARETR